MKLAQMKSLTFLRPEKPQDLKIRLWYIEFLKWNWNKNKFDSKCIAMIKYKTYGDRLDIAEWLEVDELFTMTELNLRLNKYIEDKIQRGKFLFNNYQNIDLTKGIDLDAINFYAQKEVDKILLNEMNRQIDIMIEGEKGTLIQKEATKRKRLKKLSMEKRKIIINRLIENKQLDPRIDVELSARNIEKFSLKITEFDILEAIQSI